MLVIIIIIKTETRIAPFPKLNQIKGALQKVEKTVYTKSTVKINILYLECFVFSFYLPKQKSKSYSINPHPENRKKRKKTAKNINRKNKQGNIDGEKTSSKYINCRQILRAQIEKVQKLKQFVANRLTKGKFSEHKKNVGKAKTFCCGSTGLVNIIIIH